MSKTNSNIGCRFLVTAICLFATGCSWVGLVSVSSTGEQGNNDSNNPVLSADGRFVAFDSFADNLVPGDYNNTRDVFLRDILTNTTTLVSMNNQGVQANSGSSNPSISADGRYIAYSSTANNLAGMDYNFYSDVFVYDRTSGITRRMSIDSAGIGGNAGSSSARISATGRYIAFGSSASNLVADDNNGHRDIFVHDRNTHSTTRISVDSLGGEANGTNRALSISGDGRYVAFSSIASNLVADDTNNSSDVFVHDRTTGETSRVSVDSSGNESNGESNDPSISADGRYVTFTATDRNLVPGGTGGDQQVFVHDRNTGVTSQVSIDSAGNRGDNESDFPSISGDGRYVAFESRAENLVADDNNQARDAFLHDRLTSTTKRLNVSNLGTQSSNEFQANGLHPIISADGRYTAFHSTASNLVDNDNNNDADIFVRANLNIKLTSLSPHMLPIAATTSVTLTGADFFPGTTVTIGSEWGSISNFVIVNEQTITLDITVDASAQAAAQDISVMIPGTGAGQYTGSSDHCSACITIF